MFYVYCGLHYGEDSKHSEARVDDREQSVWEGEDESDRGLL
jgi:hypothetical protein